MPRHRFLELPLVLIAAVAIGLTMLTGCGDINVEIDGQRVSDLSELVDGAPESVCGLVETLSSDRETLADSGLDPEQLRTAWTAVDRTIDEAGVAVSLGENLGGLVDEDGTTELVADWEMLVAGFQTRQALLEEVGFDPAGLDDRFDAIATPDFERARDSVSTICS